VKYKCGAGGELTWNETVREALCFGWIDTTLRPIDDTQYGQRFTPRKPKSKWSAINKKLVEELEAEGLMTDLGRQAVERAKAAGIWDVDAPSSSTMDPNAVPDDLRAALNGSKKADATWDGVSPGQKKLMLFYLASAKRAETRANRLEKIASGLSKGLRRWEEM